jgi:CheY-like chemotaxis protein
MAVALVDERAQVGVWDWDLDTDEVYVDPKLKNLLGYDDQEVREMSLDLRPTVLDDLGLLPALQWHFERYSVQTGVEIDFSHFGIDRRFTIEVETAAYRIVQEALTNIARQAKSLQPDILILDLMMPELNGLEALDQMVGCPDRGAQVVVVVDDVVLLDQPALVGGIGRRGGVPQGRCLARAAACWASVKVRRALARSFWSLLHLHFFLAASAERGSSRRVAAKKAVERADFMGRAPGVGHAWRNGFWVIVCLSIFGTLLLGY